MWKAPIAGCGCSIWGRGWPHPIARCCWRCTGPNRQARTVRGRLVARARHAYGDHTAMSAHYNRGKRSLALDLRSPAAREIALALADRADIAIEGFRPGVADRLGLGYDALAARNQRLLYLSVSGFGQDGPYAQLPCTNSVAQAFSGLMSANLGNDGALHRVGAIIVDTLTGLHAAQAVGVALYARERSGQGRRIEVSLTQCAAAILGHKLAEHLLEGGAPRALNVPTGAYRTSDGWIMIALVKEEQFARLVGALGQPDLAADPRFADFAMRAGHAATLGEIIGAIFPTDTTSGWLARLRAADILADRVNGFNDWLADPHVVATGGAIVVDQPGMGQFRTPRTPGTSVEADAGLTPAPESASTGGRSSPKSASIPRRSSGWSPRACCAFGYRHERGVRSSRHRLANNRWFEDLTIGERFAIPSRTMTEAHFSAFQTVSADNHPIHYDVEYCRERGYLRRLHMVSKSSALPPPAPGPLRIRSVTRSWGLSSNPRNF